MIPSIHSYSDRKFILEAENVTESVKILSEDVSSDFTNIIVIDDRVLNRECLLHALASGNRRIIGVDTIESFQALSDIGPTTVALLCGGQADDLDADLRSLIQGPVKLSVIMLCDSDDPDTVVRMLKAGARGYVPAISGLNVLVGAIGLVRAGGTYVPPTSLLSARGVSESFVHVEPKWQKGFTPRQLLIVDAIRQGKPNKIIAFDLGMCESTVKVHVRNVMRKMKVRNRTELAYKVSEMRICEK